MLRVNSGHLTAVTDDKIKFRFRIDLFCFPEEGDRGLAVYLDIPELEEKIYLLL